MKPLLKPEAVERLKKLSPEEREKVMRMVAEKIAAKNPLPKKDS